MIEVVPPRVFFVWSWKTVVKEDIYPYILILLHYNDPELAAMSCVSSLFPRRFVTTVLSQNIKIKETEFST